MRFIHTGSYGFGDGELLGTHEVINCVYYYVPGQEIPEEFNDIEKIYVWNEKNERVEKKFKELIFCNTLSTMAGYASFYNWDEEKGRYVYDEERST